MVKIKNMFLVANEVSLRTKPVASGSFKINPRITRKIGKLTNNQYFCDLYLFIGDTESEKLPINLNIILRGVFELEGQQSEEEANNFLKIQGVQITFPYLRTMVTNVTASALLQPIILPFFDTTQLFSEDKGLTS